ncbi:MAG TPA: signal peptidase I [Allosphingosinicella sp.]|nr:signal peptidase I [Allosphingosinicella sp.]
MNEAAKRPIPARIGIAALNLLMPGLGLLRVQRGRAAALFLLAPWSVLGLLVLGYRFLPTLTFVSWLTLVGIIIAALVAVYLGSIILSWRASARLQPSGPWWSRWYGIVGTLLAISAANALIPDFTQSTYKVFYIPSEAMAPTFLKNDHILADMRGPGVLRRGDVILLNLGQAVYIKRVAALPGDRIAMTGGIVILNGQPVRQRFVRTERVPPDMYGTQARRLSERFPGEAGSHEILDRGQSPLDDMPEQQIAPGFVFVLGDNRDQSADSRVPRAEMGVDRLPIRDIRGHALFYLWGPNGRMGEPINR